MIKVLGSSPEKIDLPELNDRIYYKQEKIFSDLDYKKSHTLRHAIDLGKIIVLERTAENKVYSQPAAVEPVDIPVALPTKIEYLPPTLGKKKDTESIDNSKLKALIDKISSLEAKFDTKEQKLVVDSIVDPSPLTIILDRLKSLEEKVSGTSPATQDNDQVLQALKSLEDKISKGQGIGIGTEDLLKRIEESVKKVGSSNIAANSGSKSNLSADMETYVPNVTVEDANSHINLKVRTIESSSSLNSSLEALKRLKNNQQS
jgi:hypothetical protein